MHIYSFLRRFGIDYFILALLAMVMLPAVGPVAKLLQSWLPDQPVATDDRKPRYLEPGALETPAEALACATREALRIGDHVEDMLKRTIDVLANDDARLAQLFARLGSTVTLLVRSRLASKEESEVSKALQEVFADEGIRVVRRAVPTRVTRESFFVAQRATPSRSASVLMLRNFRHMKLWPPSPTRSWR